VVNAKKIASRTDCSKSSCGTVSTAAKRSIDDGDDDDDEEREARIRRYRWAGPD
jgi:hypothetical protein